MKISTKGRYALRMMAELARYGDDRVISLKEISQTQEISKKYLEQIVPLLTSAGLLRTTRGTHGGYSFAKPPGTITVGEILRATEGSLAPTACLDTEENLCPRAGVCGTLYVWEGLYKVINDYLNGITLEDIVKRAPDSDGGDYCI